MVVVVLLEDGGLGVRIISNGGEVVGLLVGGWVRGGGVSFYRDGPSVVHPFFI